MTMTGTGSPPPRSKFKHRIPKTLRQHWKLLVVFVAFVSVLVFVFGETRIRPYITGDTSVIASEITDNISGTVELFDPSVSHQLSLEITDSEYNDMISSFRKSGDKKWITADITIDGTFINDASVRLKGNSTLMGVRGDGVMPGGEGFTPPDGFEIPEGLELPTDFDPQDMMAGMGSTASADDPTSLPLLISFDENSEGRAYQGMTELSVRPGSPVVNEAMALSLTADSDQPTQRYAYTVYSINDSATSTRLVLEHPDDTYANSLFESDGYLYKADASSRFAYVGDDQTAYAGQFKQINAVDNGNLQPVISFLKWMDAASSAEFDAHLSDWIDVESFARYVATQNLIVNGDDMSGPGQNYYLWYDLDTKRISVVSWDLNLAMQGDAATGPHDSVSIAMGPAGGGGPGGGAGPGGIPAGGGPGGGAGPGGIPAGEAPEGMPEGGAPRQGVDATAPGQQGFPGGPLGTTNSLKKRFLESPAFAELYEKTYWDLFEQMYQSGRSTEILDSLATSIPTSDELTAETLQSSIDQMRTWIVQRTSALNELHTP
ncbi:CotH kinase family protein [Rhodococcus erythropolis]|uniref:CotH kinase family protein n=1 Tax=Rhodococcus erythropolis TaxID=1833 RepID=UPI001E4DFBB8|nr:MULTISPECIES: CotH kinase family protein [Rhodococcus erythropolis group]MCD2107067.1 CotH kinase family protein [Rhodococcus qingshengii]MCZ4526496.1 CotH kinase family protein [Rhodococcus erythropolis]